jgi:hypothetical protein
MKFIRAGTTTSCALVLGFGLGQIVVYLRFGVGSQVTQFPYPEIFYTSFFGLLSVGLSILSLLIIFVVGNRYKRIGKVETIIWVSMIVILTLTISSIYVLIYGLGGAI